jgi:transposase
LWRPGDIEPTACPACASSLYRHGSQRQVYIDTPIHGKRVMLEIDRKRYHCKVCGKTLFAPLPDMDAKRNMTERLVRLIEQRCLKETFAALSRDIEIDDKTIRHVFDDYVESKRQSVHFETPEILGIDELKIVGEYRCMLTNIEKQSVFDLLPSRRKVDLTEYFKILPNKKPPIGGFLFGKICITSSLPARLWLRYFLLLQQRQRILLYPLFLSPLF